MLQEVEMRAYTHLKQLTGKPQAAWQFDFLFLKNSSPSEWLFLNREEH